MSIVYSGDQITFPDQSVQNTAPKVGMVNRIINGAMMIDQRNAGASVAVTDTSNLTYTLDRWSAFGSAASKFSIQQDAGAVTPPAGFTDYLGVTSLAATSVGTSDQYTVGQIIEGFNIADLGWGTANAQPVTLSFWVRSSLTGTFGGAIVNSGFARGYGFTYVINTANTWEQKSVTIAGDTTGTWLTTNGIGINVRFGLGVGSTLSAPVGSWSAGSYRSAVGATSVVGTNGATFYITGVQLEKGSTATSFDYRPYGTELALCRRYFKWMPALQGNFITGGSAVFLAGVGETIDNMRATPTATLVSGTDGIHVSNVANYNITSLNDMNINYFRVNTNASAGSYAPGHYNSGNKISLSSEL